MRYPANKLINFCTVTKLCNMTLRLNKFCCCCTTRTGALVIGTLGWILTLVQIFGGVDPDQREHDEKLQRELYGNSEYERSKYSKLQNNIYFKVGYGLVTLLVCVLLVVGIYKKNKRFILPWLVLKGLEAALIAIGTAILFFVACMHGQGILFAIFFLVLLLTVLHCYFWLCVWSHYKDLEEEPVANTAAYSTAHIPPPQYMEKPHNMA